MNSRHKEPHYEIARLVVDIIPRAVLADALVHVLTKEGVQPTLAEVMLHVQAVQGLPRESARDRRKKGW